MKARREDADAANVVDDDDDGNDLGCGGDDVVHANTIPNELSIRKEAAATAVVVILMLMVQWMSSISMIGFFLF